MSDEAGLDQVIKSFNTAPEAKEEEKKEIDISDINQIIAKEVQERK